MPKNKLIIARLNAIIADTEAKIKTAEARKAMALKAIAKLKQSHND